MSGRFHKLFIHFVEFAFNREVKRIICKFVGEVLNLHADFSNLSSQFRNWVEKSKILLLISKFKCVSSGLARRILKLRAGFCNCTCNLPNLGCNSETALLVSGLNAQFAILSAKLWDWAPTFGIVRSILRIARETVELGVKSQN